MQHVGELGDLGVDLLGPVEEVELEQGRLDEHARHQLANLADLGVPVPADVEAALRGLRAPDLLVWHNRTREAQQLRLRLQREGQPLDPLEDEEAEGVHEVQHGEELQGEEGHVALARRQVLAGLALAEP